MSERKLHFYKYNFCAVQKPEKRKKVKLKGIGKINV